MAPHIQPWITRIDPTVDSKQCTLELSGGAACLEQPRGRFLAGQRGDFGAVAILRVAAPERPVS